MSTAFFPRRKFGDQGFVLVAALWMLAALATLVSIYSAYTSSTAIASHLGDDRLQAEASIRSAVELALYRQLSGSAEASRERFDIRIGRTAISAQLTPESARIDLNAASRTLLAGMFAAAGENPGRAQFLTDRVLGWRTKGVDAGHDAEGRFYADQHMAYGPRQAPFESVLELSLLPGFSPQLVERLLPMVTVYSGRAKISVADADPAVLSALPGMTPAVLGVVLKARAKGVAPEELLKLLAAAKDYADAEVSEAIRATVAVDFDNGRRVHADVVFRPGKNDKEPYDILYWSDDFDGPASSA